MRTKQLFQAQHLPLEPSNLLQPHKLFQLVAFHSSNIRLAILYTALMFECLLVLGSLVYTMTPHPLHHYHCCIITCNVRCHHTPLFCIIIVSTPD